MIVVMLLVIIVTAQPSAQIFAGVNSYKATSMDFKDYFDGKERWINVSAWNYVKRNENITETGEKYYSYTCNKLDISLWDTNKSFTAKLGYNLSVNAFMCNSFSEKLLTAYKDHYLGYDNMMCVEIPSYEGERYLHFFQIDGNKIFDYGWIEVSRDMSLCDNRKQGELTISHRFAR